MRCKETSSCALKKKRQVRVRREIIDAPHPLRRAAAHGVSCERGENIAVAEHDVTGAQQRHQLAFVAVGEIRGVDEAEGGGREQFAFFAFAGRGLDEFGGIPFAEKNLQALQFQPAFEEVDLCGFAGAVQPLDRDEAPRKIEFGKSLRHSPHQNKPPAAENN